MAFPKFPDGLRDAFNKAGMLGAYFWIAQDFTTWITTKFDTKGDMTFLTPGKGPILKNAAGDIKRVRLNDTGTDILLEDV